LLELIVVLVLLAILGAVVGPAITGSIPSARVRKAGDAFLATAKKARMDAVLTAKRHRFVLRTTPTTEGERPSFFITFEARPLEEAGVFKPVPGAWGKPTELPEFVTFGTVEGSTEDTETGDHYVEFLPDGTAKDATLILQNAQGEPVSITIKGSTGDVRFTEVTP
jgi:type II secretory pathway pseudopilin PulG